MIRARRYFPTQRNLFDMFILLVTLVLVFLQVNRSGPEYGDIGVWVFIHEWLSRGTILYTGIWDHKDFGFFYFTQPFYEWFSVRGLFISGFIATLLYGAGVFTILTDILSRRIALLFTCGVVASYVIAPSYLSTYVENYSIALAVFALAIFSRFPVFSGILFAVSTSIKMSGFLTWSLLVVLCLVFQAYGNFEILSLHKLKRNVFSFISTSILILAVAFKFGSLSGWLDISIYNAQYATYRRGGHSILYSIKYFVSSFLFANLHVTQFLLSLFFIFFTLLYYIARCKVRILTNDSVNVTIIRVFALLLGSTLILVLQSPLSYQHFQYLVGPLLLFCICLVASVIKVTNNWNSNPRKIFISCIMIFPLIMGLFFEFGGNPGSVVKREIGTWRSLNNSGLVLHSLNNVPTGSSTAFFGIDTGEGIRATLMPRAVTLECNFVYQFPWLLSRYEKRIISCLDKNPRFIFIRTTSWHDQNLRKSIYEKLSRRYFKCGQPEKSFEEWVRQASDCKFE